MKDIYKELSKLFPSTLAVGDVVEYKSRTNSKTCKGTIIEILDNYVRLKETSFLYEKKDLIKRISLSMVLEAMKTKNEYGNKIDDNGIFWISDIISEMPCKEKHKWIFQKDGKDLSLYDQSEETTKFIYGVLK